MNEINMEPSTRFDAMYDLMTGTYLVPTVIEKSILDKLSSIENALDLLLQQLQAMQVLLQPHVSKEDNNHDS